MIVIKDLIGGSKPQPIELPYNGDIEIDSTTLRYKGSLVKLHDIDDFDEGVFCTWAGDSTAMENIIGVLEEEQPITGNYLMTDATYGFRYRKITPIFPSTVLEAEYARKDPAGTAICDTTAAASAAGTTFTITATEDKMNGGWIYFLTGANKDYLHYVVNGTSTTSLTLATATKHATAIGDTFLVIHPPMANLIDFDAHLVNLLSDPQDGGHIIQGLNTWVTAPGLAKTRLARNTHDGLKVSNARFYHQFTLPGNATLPNVWTSGLKAA